MAEGLDTVIGAEQTRRGDTQAAARHIAESQEAFGAGDRAAGVSLLRRAVSADPASPDALFQLAYRLDLIGEEDEAIALYERAVGADPAPINALMNLAVLYEDRGEYTRAEHCLRQVLETKLAHERARLFMKDVLASRDMELEDDRERDITKRKALLETPVTDFDLTVRARTCLKKMNIRTLGDLLRITEAELVGYKNFGGSSLDEIKKMLKVHNLRLGQGLEDAHRSARRQVTDRLRATGKEAILAKPVTDLQLSVRARKALQLLNIQTIGDLVSHTEPELMGVKNFGQTSLVEVREGLAQYGLALRTLTDEAEIEDDQIA